MLRRSDLIDEERVVTGRMNTIAQRFFGSWKATPRQMFSSTPADVVSADYSSLISSDFQKRLSVYLRPRVAGILRLLYLIIIF